MSDVKPPHFEEIWNQSELVSSAEYSSSTIQELLDELSISIKGYQEIHETDVFGDDNKHELKFRLMGKMLYILTAMSARDNMNVYKALKDHVEASSAHSTK